MSRIALFGGTFDPPHNAHVALAHAALAALDVAEVRWVPSGQPWQKAGGRTITPAMHRVAMVEAAIRGAGGDARFTLDRIEIERSGPSYTLDTVRALVAREPANTWVLLIGQDQYAGLHTWHGWRELLDLVTLAVANRPGVARPPSPEVLAWPHRVVPLPMLDISATEIRARIAAGQPVTDLVPAEVAGYIDRHGLYTVDGTPLNPPAPAHTEEQDLDIRKLQRAIVDGLEDVKAQNIVVFNTEALSPLFERVIIASGNSNRQTKALASSVRETVKKRGLAVLRTEGEDNGEWIIVDCGAAVAHIMQPAIRDYYHLEEIWGAKPVRLKGAGDAAGPRPLPKASEPDAAEARPARATGKTTAKTASGAAPRGASPTARKAPARAAKTAARPAAKSPARGAGQPAAKSPARKAGGAAPASKAAPKTVRKPAPRAAPAAKKVAKKTAPRKSGGTARPR